VTGGSNEVQSRTFIGLGASVDCFGVHLDSYCKSCEGRGDTVKTTGGRTVFNYGMEAQLSLTDKLYHRILDDILSWTIKPGELLIEARLAKEYKVSKTPVREALGLLSQEGFVEVIPRVGYRVTEVTPRDVYEVFTLRTLLETEGVALAAKNASDEELGKLYEDGEELAAKIDSGEVTPEKYLQLHDSFHVRLALLSGNRRLASYVARLLRDWVRVRLRDPELTPDSVRINRRDSKAICEALLRRDGKTAKRLLREHINKSMEEIRSHLA